MGKKQDSDLIAKALKTAITRDVKEAMPKHGNKKPTTQETKGIK